MPSCYQTVYDTGIPPHGADLLLLLSLDLFECASAMLHVDTFYSAGVKDAARRVCRQWLGGQRDAPVEVPSPGAVGHAFTRFWRAFSSADQAAIITWSRSALADAPHWADVKLWQVLLRELIEAWAASPSSGLPFCSPELSVGRLQIREMIGLYDAKHAELDFLGDAVQSHWDTLVRKRCGHWFDASLELDGIVSRHSSNVYWNRLREMVPVEELRGLEEWANSYAQQEQMLSSYIELPLSR